MNTIVEYIQKKHIISKLHNPDIIDCFIDIDAKYVNNPQYKDYIMFRDWDWRIVKYIKDEDLFKTDVSVVVNALNELFKDNIGNIFVEIMGEQSGSFQKAITISLHGYVLDKINYSEKTKKIYDYFNSFKK